MFCVYCRLQAIAARRMSVLEDPFFKINNDINK